MCASILSCVQLFAILWTTACQVPLVLAFANREYLSGLLCSPSGDLPNQGIKPVSLISPALADGFFTTSITWEAPQKDEVRLICFNKERDPKYIYFKKCMLYVYYIYIIYI